MCVKFKSFVWEFVHVAKWACRQIAWLIVFGVCFFGVVGICLLGLLFYGSENRVRGWFGILRIHVS